MAPRTAAAPQTIQPENIGDVEEGYTPEAEGQVDELGLTPEDRAVFDGMRDADRGLSLALLRLLGKASVGVAHAVKDRAILRRQT